MHRLFTKIRSYKTTGSSVQHEATSNLSISHKDDQFLTNIAVTLEVPSQPCLHC